MQPRVLKKNVVFFVAPFLLKGKRLSKRSRVCLFLSAFAQALLPDESKGGTLSNSCKAAVCEASGAVPTC